MLLVVSIASLGNVALAALNVAERLREAPPEVPVLFREDGLPELLARWRTFLREAAGDDAPD